MNNSLDMQLQMKNPDGIQIIWRIPMIHNLEKLHKIIQERSETDFLRNETEDPFAEVLHRGKRNLKTLVTELVSFEFRSIELNIERLLYKDLSQGSRICILMT